MALILSSNRNIAALLFSMWFPWLFRSTLFNFFIEMILQNCLYRFLFLFLAYFNTVWQVILFEAVTQNYRWLAIARVSVCSKLYILSDIIVRLQIHWTMNRFLTINMEFDYKPWIRYSSSSPYQVRLQNPKSKLCETSLDLLDLLV